jgi:RNase adapter protein RapZ
VDNLPPALLDGFLALRDSEGERYRRIALVLDIRVGDPAPAIAEARAALDRRQVPSQLLFLEASDEVLIRRYSETRHRHPLQSQRGVEGGIVEERRRLNATRRLADNVIDTSGLSIGQLKERLLRLAPRTAPQGLAIDILTFGFKHGLPLEADLVFDVRFLSNPYYVPDLKPLSGLDASVRDFVLEQPAAASFLQIVDELLALTIPAYRAEGKTRLTLALGCTGGYHRSIVLAEEIARRLDEGGAHSVAVSHRELER